MRSTAMQRLGAPRLAQTAAAAGRPERLVGRLLSWADRRRERRRLLAFSDHMLKDIGLTRADVEREASKPFWRA